MTCPICRKQGHSASDCPSAPEGVGKKDFTEAERRQKEEEIGKIKDGFFAKVKRIAGKVPFIPDAVSMYYCMLDPKTPFWVKASIAGALAYFISPIDAIPDVIPVVGYADDAAVVYMTLAIIHGHVTEAHVSEAKRWLG